jgi:hypothetical protein
MLGALAGLFVEAHLAWPQQINWEMQRGQARLFTKYILKSQ